jgi:hypothetical protein
MEKNIKPLPTELQVMVLEDAKKRILEGKHIGGLCPLMTDTLLPNVGIGCARKDIALYIPLYNQENAIEYCNASKYCFPYWWPPLTEKKVFNKEDRLKFLDWMLNELRQ